VLRISGAIVFAVCVLLAGCGDDVAEPPASTVATTAGETTIERYEVASSVETFVDDARATPANGSFPGAPSRTIETKIYRPVPPGDGEDGDGFPLIVFSHGIDDDDERYEAVLAEWAASGYVVAAPNFPLSRKDAPGGPTLADLDNQPGDLQFVTEEVRRLAAEAGHELEGLVGDETALAGKSFGAITTLNAVYGPDPVAGPVDAVVSMAGGLDDRTGLDGADTPLLLIHGEDDERVPYQSSVDVFAAANPPKYFLTLIDEGHTGAYNGGDSAVEVLVPQASLDFFDAYLKGDDDALERLTSDYDVAGVATLDAVPG
jgi:dipeptidyl aminopeptidase/acylaminoacyl peptidase